MSSIMSSDVSSNQSIYTDFSFLNVCPEVRVVLSYHVCGHVLCRNRKTNIMDK